MDPVEIRLIFDRSLLKEASPRLFRKIGYKMDSFNKAVLICKKLDQFSITSDFANVIFYNF
jgi:hypothetical protein